MEALYDSIGLGYTLQRTTDPCIARQLYSHLEGAETILNIGAGTGSYEPDGASLIALEPSTEMLRQRHRDALPAVQGTAESMPFKDKCFSHAMTVLSLHHWKNRRQAFTEISRVTRETFIALSWDPHGKPFWLTRDYFPEIYSMDKNTFPGREEFSRYFDDVKIETVPIPASCKDGFLAAFWKRPRAYLDATVQTSISSFSKLGDYSAGINQLERDLGNGTWKKKNQALLEQDELDAGYIIVRGKIRS